MNVYPSIAKYTAHLNESASSVQPYEHLVKFPYQSCHQFCNLIAIKTGFRREGIRPSCQNKLNLHFVKIGFYNSVALPAHTSGESVTS